jgi:hypothetical protein
MPRATKMRVVTVDEHGKELGDANWVDIPEPDHFASDGFAQIESYVLRLLRSPARFTSVIIATPDGQIAVSLWHRGGVPEFTLSVDWRSQPERERAVRQFFSARRLLTSRDYLAGNGGIPDASRHLGYFVPAEVQSITTLTKDVLREIYHLQEQDALDFSYEEHHDAV